MRPKKVILLVDADPHALSVRRFLLETHGYRVLTAGTAQDVLQVLEVTVPGTLDLLLAELVLPVLGGNELARRAKQMQPGLPVLLVSATVAAFDRVLYADVFLPKGGQSAAEVLDRVRTLTARRRGPKKVLRPFVEVDLVGAQVAA